MGIEGSSNNNEIQSQEIQQANIEQNEQNQADHKRSGEELEANSTIDNEGERKQIEGREEGFDTKDSNISKLDESDFIDENTNESELDYKEGDGFQDTLDDLSTIEDDFTAMDDYYDGELQDSLDDELIDDEETPEDELSEDVDTENDRDFSEGILDDDEEESGDIEDESREEAEEDKAEKDENAENKEVENTVENTEKEGSVEAASKEEVQEDKKETEGNADNKENAEVENTVEDTEKEEPAEAASKEEVQEGKKETEGNADNKENAEVENTVEDTEKEEPAEAASKEEAQEGKTETEGNVDNKENAEVENTVEDTEKEEPAEAASKEEAQEGKTETEDNVDNKENAEVENTVEVPEKEENVEDSREEAQNGVKEMEKKDAADSSDNEKLPDKAEDLSMKQVYELLKTPEGKEVLNNMLDESKERLEAEMRDMSVEEYRDYKVALARADYERKKENGEIPPRNPSDIERNAGEVLETFNYQDEKSSHAYMLGAKTQDLKDISDKNHELIKQLKGARQDIESEHDKVWDKIASMNYDGSRDYNPEEYEKLCEHYRDLESLGKQLDYAIVKTDMNNWDISQVAGLEYRNESKRLTDKEISSTFKDADSILRDGVTDNVSIMDAYSVGEKLEHDVLPSLDGERRELESRLNVYEHAQTNYRKEHFCTHEEAMKTPDGSYAQNEREIQKIKEEVDTVSGRMIDAVEKATALREQLPIAESDFTLKVIDNKDGTITIERAWDNGGTEKKSHEGHIHSSETLRYYNAKEKKDSITLGKNSDSVYSHSFSFQYRGLGFKREDTWGSGDKRLKNVAEGGFLNFNASFGYKRGVEGTKSTLKADAGGSLAQFKETASLIVKDKEYKGFAAEVSLLKESASVSVDSKGLVKASASAHIAGGEVAISAGGVNIAKISGGIGEAKVSLSTNPIDAGASTSMGEYKSSVSVWSVLKNEDSATENDDKQLIEAKGSASIGNGISLVRSKISSINGEVKNTTVVDTLKKDATDFVDGIKVGSININGDIVSGIAKDVKAIKDIKEGNLGTDISKKPKDIVLGNAKIKEKPEDFESKIVDHSVLKKESHNNIDLGVDLKRSLEPFNQSKWDDMSFDERKEAITKLADSVAKDLELENQPDIKYYQSDEPGDYGGFSASENAIYINANNIDDAAETADTIAHETRHCWQHEMVENNPNAPESRRFAGNFEDYIKPQDDYVEYRNQPVEADAREYAALITDSISREYVKDNVEITDNTSPKVDTYKTESIEKGAVFERLPSDVNSKIDTRAEVKVPVSDVVMKSLEGSGLTIEKINEIRDMPKPDYSNGETVNRDKNKPDPKTYLNPEYYQKHLEPFEKTGCYRIQRTDPMLPDDQYEGVLGHNSGLFVTSGKDMMKALKEAEGDVSKLEKIFGMNEGEWGKNPVVIRIDNPQNLRIPDGNELGAWPKYFIPGGFTAGNQAEAVIDSVPRGEYQVMKFNDPELVDWMKKEVGD